MVGAALQQVLFKAPQAKLALNFLIFGKHRYLSPHTRHDVKRQTCNLRQHGLESIPERQDIHPLPQMAVAVSSAELLQLKGGKEKKKKNSSSPRSKQ